MQRGLRQLTIDLLSLEQPCRDIHALAQRHACKLVGCAGRNKLAGVNRHVAQLAPAVSADTITYDIARTQRDQARYITEAFARVLILRNGWRSPKTLTGKQVDEVADAIEEWLEYGRAVMR